MKILGLDPGKSTGYAMIEVEGKKITPLPIVGTELNENVKIIANLMDDADVVVCEAFKLDPKKMHGQKWNDMVASRVIGKIDLLCEMKEKKLIMQPASDKPVAYGFSGMKYVKGKQGMHHFDAFAHAVFYAVKRLHCSPLAMKK